MLNLSATRTWEEGGGRTARWRQLIGSLNANMSRSRREYSDGGLYENRFRLLQVSPFAECWDSISRRK